MRPRVVLHNVASVDGRIDHIRPDVGLYYSLASRWQADATLAGSRTIASGDYAADPDDLNLPLAAPAPDDSRAMLVVPDSRGIVRGWGTLRAAGYWKDYLSLCARSTPAEHLAYLARVGVRVLVAGEERVDLAAALEALAEQFAVRVVRVDSGGTLNGALLRAGLVDEVSLLVHPALVGGTSPRSIYRAEDLVTDEGALPLRLLAVEQLAGEVVWVRYEVVHPGA